MDEIGFSSCAQGFDSAASLLPRTVSEALMRLPQSLRASASEIRLDSKVTTAFPDRQPDRTVSGSCDIRECFLQLCRHSVYCFQDSIAQGFIPLPGGHRAGLCGSAVTENGAVTGMRDISMICIRIARQLSGASDMLKDRMLGTRGMLIAGAPCSGKTTILRDAACALASGRWGRRYRVAVIDCRGELCAVYNGKPQLDTGGSFVLDGFPKSSGMLQAVRCLAPEYIICDEIGGPEDTDAVTACSNTGAAVIAAVHAGSIGELLRRPQTGMLIGCGAFDTAVMLDASRTGRVGGVYRINNNSEEEQNEMDRFASDNTLRAVCGKRTLLKIG